MAMPQRWVWGSVVVAVNCSVCAALNVMTPTALPVHGCDVVSDPAVTTTPPWSHNATTYDVLPAGSFPVTRDSPAPASYEVSRRMGPETKPLSVNCAGKIDGFVAGEPCDRKIPSATPAPTSANRKPIANSLRSPRAGSGSVCSTVTERHDTTALRTAGEHGEGSRTRAPNS